MTDPISRGNLDVVEEAILELETQMGDSDYADACDPNDIRTLISAYREAERDATAARERIARLEGALRVWIEADDALLRAMFLAHDDPANEANRELASKWTKPLRAAREDARAALSPSTPKEPT